jgi:hypothetical protein
MLILADWACSQTAAGSDRVVPEARATSALTPSARLVLWEGGGSVCDETIFATMAAAVLAEARERAHRLVAAYPTQPDLETELAERVDARSDP